MASSKNIGDQIRDAVNNAVDSQDYSNLQRTIEQSFGTAAVNIGRSIAQAQDSFKRAQAEYANEQQRLQKERIRNQREAQQAQIRLKQQRQLQAQMQTLYNDKGGSRGVGIALVTLGALIVASLGPASLAVILTESIAAAIPWAVCGVIGIVLLVMGISKILTANTFDKYKTIIGLREYCYVTELAAHTGDKPENVLKNLKKMLSNGFFKQAALDDSETMIITTTQAYEQYRQAQAEFKKRQRQENLAGSVSADSKSKQPLTPEAKALLSRGEAYVAKIRLSNDAIPGEEISRKIDQIEQVVRTIFKRAEEHPQVIDDLGHLMDYYLPTTVKLLDAYRDLDSQPIAGENIQKSKREIEGALDSLAVAFEKLLDSVFQDMAWDVSSDVSVLHTVLAQEGLVESPFDMKK